MLFGRQTGKLLKSLDTGHWHVDLGEALKHVAPMGGNTCEFG